MFKLKKRHNYAEFEPNSNCYVAAAVIGGAVVSAGVGAAASSSAASKQAAAANNAANTTLEATQETNQLNYQIYENNLANLSPQLQAQQEAESALASGLGLGGLNSGSNQMGLGSGTSNGGYYGANVWSTNTSGNSPTGPGSQTYASTPTFQATTQGTPTTPAISGSSNGSGIMMQPLSATSTSTGIPPGQTNIAQDIKGTSSTPTAVYGQQTPGATQYQNGSSTSTGTGINGVGTGSLLTPGATQGQLNSAGASQSSGSLLANFNNQDLNSQLSPSYAFIQGQGQTALQNYNAAHGISGGNATNAETQYAQNTASTYYQQAFQNYLTQQQQNISSLSSLAGNGAATSANSAGTSAGSTIGSTTMSGVGASTGYQTSGAAASAAGTVGVANSISGAIGSGTSGLMLNKYLGNSSLSSSGGNIAGWDGTQSAIQSSVNTPIYDPTAAPVSSSLSFNPLG